MNCVSVEDIENIQDIGSQTICARNFIHVPPFLIHTISVSIVVNKGTTGKISLDVIKDIKEFDELHEDYSSFTEKAATKCKHLLHWFYVAEKWYYENSIVQIQFASCMNDTLINQVKDFKDAHLVQLQNPQDQVAQALVAPLEKLSASSRTTQEAVFKMTFLQ